MQPNKHFSAHVPRPINSCVFHLILQPPTDAARYISSQPSPQRRNRWTSAVAAPVLRPSFTPGPEESAAPRKVREEDQEYYRTHKPSPSSSSPTPGKSPTRAPRPCSGRLRPEGTPTGRTRSDAAATAQPTSPSERRRAAEQLKKIEEHRIYGFRAQLLVFFRSTSIRPVLCHG
jgi:hypothetical protein